MLKYFIYISLILTVKALDEDALKSVSELVKKYGYLFEEHEVTTSDGYHLGLHRIPNGKDDAKASDKKVVLIMHQFLTSSADFVSMGNRSLAFLLADLNYDVWLGNARGNTHSKKHDSLKPTNANFWSFTWVDVGKYDLPAIIDHILLTTDVDKIDYIGHGQGSTVFYVMASEVREYREKINKMVALAPVVYMDGMPNPVFRILGTLLPGFSMKLVFAVLRGLIDPILELLGIIVNNELLGNNGSGTFAMICDDDTLLVEVCLLALSGIYGYDPDQMERPKIPVFFTNAFAGSSYKQLEEYMTYYYTNDFAKKFDMTDINIPTAIFYGKNDWLTSAETIDQLVTDLNENGGNVVKYEVANENWNHMDFVFGKDVKKLVYDRVFEFLNDEDNKKKIEL